MLTRSKAGGRGMDRLYFGQQRRITRDNLFQRMSDRRMEFVINVT